MLRSVTSCGVADVFAEVTIRSAFYVCGIRISYESLVSSDDSWYWIRNVVNKLKLLIVESNEMAVR